MVQRTLIQSLAPRLNGVPAKGRFGVIFHMRSAVWLIERPRWFKRTLLILNDIAMLTIALWAAYSLRLSQFYVPETFGMVVLFAAAPIIGVITFHVRGLYKLVTRFIGPEGTTRIYVAVIIAVLAWALLVLLSGIKGHPRSVVVIYGLIAAGLIRLTRQWAGAMLLRAAPQHKPVNFDERKNVIIYGAGTIGIQLLRALNETGHYNMVAFIDNNPSLAGQVVHGVKVLRPGKIGKVITTENVKEVLLAMPSALRSERRAAIRALEPFPVVVKTLPALEEIASGHVEVSDLRPIEVEDLLGRDPVAPELELLTAHVQDKVVMITGAGGSIGSELTRQLLELGPKALILFELSEVALYEIEMEIEERSGAGRRSRSQRRSPTPRSFRCSARCSTASSSARTIAQIRRRGDLSRRRLQARPHRRDEPVHRRAEQHLRHAGAGRDRQGGSASSASCSCRATRRCGRPTSWARASGWPS